MISYSVHAKIERHFVNRLNLVMSALLAIKFHASLKYNNNDNNNNKVKSTIDSTLKQTI